MVRRARELWLKNRSHNDRDGAPSEKRLAPPQLHARVGVHALSPRTGRVRAGSRIPCRLWWKIAEDCLFGGQITADGQVGSNPRAPTLMNWSSSLLSRLSLVYYSRRSSAASWLWHGPGPVASSRTGAVLAASLHGQRQRWRFCFPTHPTLYI